MKEKLVVEVLNMVKLKPELGVKFFISTERQIGYNHAVFIVRNR